MLPKFDEIQDLVYIKTETAEVKAEPVFPEDHGPGAFPKSIHYLKARVELTKVTALVFRRREINAEVSMLQTVLEAFKNSIVAEEINWSTLTPQRRL